LTDWTGREPSESRLARGTANLTAVKLQQLCLQICAL
jgi:hypothetical protein